MFHPDLIYIPEDQNQRQEFWFNELLVVLFMCLQNCIFPLVFVYFIYSVGSQLLPPLGLMIWSLLTPGRQYLELAFVLTSAAIPIVTLILFLEMEKTITKLRAKIQAQEAELKTKK